MNKPKKPTLKKKPKAPKTNASKNAWDNFEKKGKSVKAENDKKTKAYDSEMKKYDSEVKRRQNLKDKY